MKKLPFFVTYVFILAIAGLVVCKTAKGPRSLKNSRAWSHEQRELVSEGNAKLLEATQIQSELSKNYLVILSADKRAAPSTFDWKTVTLDQRREIQGSLAQYLSAIHRVLAIDAKRDITVDHRERILITRDQAQALQKSIEGFEQVYGENFNPKVESGLKTVEN